VNALTYTKEAEKNPERKRAIKRRCNKKAIAKCLSSGETNLHEIARQVGHTPETIKSFITSDEFINNYKPRVERKLAILAERAVDRAGDLKEASPAQAIIIAGVAMDKMKTINELASGQDPYHPDKQVHNTQNNVTINIADPSVIEQLAKSLSLLSQSGMVRDKEKVIEAEVTEVKK
jgi:hypothetical protein